MKNFFAILFVLSLTVSTTAAEKWATPPKSITFAEFKFFKNAPDIRTGVVTFTKQKTPGFTLAKAFEGDKTEICYGSTMPAPQTKAKGVGCVLKAIGAKSCNEVTIDKCMADTSIKPVN